MRYQDFPASYPLNVRASTMVLRTIRAAVTEDAEAVEAIRLRLTRPDIGESLLLVTSVAMCAVAVQQLTDERGVLDLDAVLAAVGGNCSDNNDGPMSRTRAAVFAATLGGVGYPELLEPMLLDPAGWSSTWPAIVEAITSLLWLQANGRGEPAVVAYQLLVKQMMALPGHARQTARASR